MEAAPHSIERRRFRWRGAIAGVVLLPAAAVALFSQPIVPPRSFIHVAIVSLAWTAFLAGAGFRFWAMAYVGGRKERELVTEGPYSLCRHPLYLGSLLLGLSAGLFIESPLFVLGIVAVAFIYVRTTIAVEEAVLVARHGAAHERYTRTVPCLVPHSRRVVTPPQITVDVYRMWLECLRASRWMWLPLLGTIFGHLRALVWWPRLFRGL